jgi:hypothetical protein
LTGKLVNAADARCGKGVTFVDKDIDAKYVTVVTFSEKASEVNLDN